MSQIIIICVFNPPELSAHSTGWRLVNYRVPCTSNIYFLPRFQPLALESITGPISHSIFNGTFLLTTAAAVVAACSAALFEIMNPPSGSRISISPLLIPLSRRLSATV